MCNYNNFDFDVWKFLELYMPNYSISDEIAWINDIECVLNNEIDDDERREQLNEIL